MAKTSEAPSVVFAAADGSGLTDIGLITYRRGEPFDAADPWVNKPENAWRFSPTVPAGAIRRTVESPEALAAQRQIGQDMDKFAAAKAAEVEQAKADELNRKRAELGLEPTLPTVGHPVFSR
jgi:hypothetical protein